MLPAGSISKEWNYRLENPLSLISAVVQMLSITVPSGLVTTVKPTVYQSMLYRNTARMELWSTLYTAYTQKTLLLEIVTYV